MVFVDNSAIGKSTWMPTVDEPIQTGDLLAMITTLITKFIRSLRNRSIQPQCKTYSTR